MVKITSDSTADLDYLFEKEGIDVMPLSVNLDGNDYLDGVDINPQMIFEKFDEKGILPKTAARPIEEYVDFFEKNLTSDGLIHFTISAELSVSYQNALTASKRFSNVYVVDSRSLSTGIGLLVLKALDKAKAGKSASEIYADITALTGSVQASFVVSTMDYLHKGGRCSGLAAFFGKAFQVKPMLMLRKGKIEVGQKYIGGFSKNVLKYVDAIFRQFDTPDFTRIFVTHTYADEEVVEAVKQRIREVYPQFKEIYETKAGCTVTSHCGKGTLGILYINDPKA